MRTFIVIAATTLFAVPVFAEDAATVRVFKAKCGSCHGADGKGDTDQGKKLKVRDMTSAEFQKATDDKLKAAIVDGVKAEGKEVMKGYKSSLKPEQIDALLAYVRAFKK